MGSSQTSQEPWSRDSQKVHKKEMRRTLRAARRERRDIADLPRRAADGRALARHAMSMPQIAQARCVTIFEPTDLEPDVSYLTKELAATARILVPITLTNLELDWRDIDSDEPLGLDGIALADVVIAPALGIGVHGERLGQGGGCYDKALPRRRRGTPVVATAFPDEVGVEVPIEPHDEFVDAVVTSEGIIKFTSGSPGRT